MVRTLRLTVPIAGKGRTSVEGWTVDRLGDWGVQFSGRSLDRNRQWKRSGDVGSSKDKEQERGRESLTDGGRWEAAKTSESRDLRVDGRDWTLDNEKAVKAVVYIVIAGPKLHAVSPLLSRVRVSVVAGRDSLITYSLHLAGRTNHVRLYPPQQRSSILEPSLVAACCQCRESSCCCFGLPTNHIRFSQIPSLFKVRRLSPLRLSWPTRRPQHLSNF